MNFNALDISSSALTAQRIKMDAIAGNIANVNTTRNPDGTPGIYRRKEVIFSSVYGNMVNGKNNNDEWNTDETNTNADLKGSVSQNSVSTLNGVKVLQVADDFKTPLNKVYNPSHPDADKDGYVNLPNVNVVSEMVDMISASRAYEANVTSINATKSMISAAMKI
ncbi:MAG TPA: flagellar basal body rod protein FlgC [Cyanobacteria bacterium UBA9971]|nr:flagellar basal body rod protein FlgC [Cyanobacteria bacterium UBA9971]